MTRRLPFGGDGKSILFGHAGFMHVRGDVLESTDIGVQELLSRVLALVDVYDGMDERIGKCLHLSLQLLRMTVIARAVTRTHAHGVNPCPNGA